MGGSSVYMYIYIKEIKEMIMGEKYSNLKFCKIYKEKDHKHKVTNPSP